MQCGWSNWGYKNLGIKRTAPCDILWYLRYIDSITLVIEYRTNNYDFFLCRSKNFVSQCVSPFPTELGTWNLERGTWFSKYFVLLYHRARDSTVSVTTLDCTAQYVDAAVRVRPAAAPIRITYHREDQISIDSATPLKELSSSRLSACLSNKTAEWALDVKKARTFSTG